MECILTGNQIRAFSRAMQCLAKVAQSEHITFEAGQDRLLLRALNLPKSAFLAISFKWEFFDGVRQTAPRASCCVLVKSILTVFRTPPGNMASLAIYLDSSAAEIMKWTINCLNGVRKTYSVTCLHSPEILFAAVDRASFPSYLIVKPKDLSRLLGNFQSTLAEIILIATEPLYTPLDTESGSQEAKAVELRSFVDPSKIAPDGGNLHTQLWLDPSEELQAYHHVGEATDVTFSIKELKAFMSFCEGAEADIKMFFDKAGSPVLFVPCFGAGDSLDSDFQAELVVATMMESQLRPDHTFTPSAPQAGTSASEQARRGPDSQPNSGPTSEQNQADASHLQQPERGPQGQSEAPQQESERTNIWSELSGSDTRMRSAASGRRASNSLPQESAQGSEEIHLQLASGSGERHLSGQRGGGQSEPGQSRMALGGRGGSEEGRPPSPQLEPFLELPLAPPQPPAPSKPWQPYSRKSKRADTGEDQEAPQSYKENAENFLEELLGPPPPHITQRRDLVQPDRELDREDTGVPGVDPYQLQNPWIINSPEESEDEF